MSPGNERSPRRGTEGARSKADGQTLTRIMPDEADIERLARRTRDGEWLEDCLLNFAAGFDRGYARGRADAVEDFARGVLHEQAAAVVTGLAELPERDPVADRGRAARRAGRTYGSGAE